MMRDRVAEGWSQGERVMEYGVRCGGGWNIKAVAVREAECSMGGITEV